MTQVPPIRLLTAVPICDGHDSAINTINVELIRNGIEVVYLGYHRSVRDIVRAALQEDVRGVGISSYNGGHIDFFTQVAGGLRQAGADEIAVFGGGGGTITRADASVMQRRGVDRIFASGASLSEIVDYIRKRFAAPLPRKHSVLARSSAFTRSGTSKRPHGGGTPNLLATPFSFDRRLAIELTRIECSLRAPRKKHATGSVRTAQPRVIGITGPGGAGKTTLIDELVSRLLASDPDVRIGILSHDPSTVARGALLGDRAAMIYSQHDRVFMRSMASRDRPGGLSPATERCLLAMRAARPAFDVIFVETVGTGQEAMPFPAGLVDRNILVMSPDYGSRLQLQKIVMLDAADIVVANKCDLPGSRTAAVEIEQRLADNGREQRLFITEARRHRDPGADALLHAINGTKEA